MTIIDELQQLAKAHPPLHDDKANKKIEKLERMAFFYSSKIGTTEIPIKQESLFRGFVSSIAYAITIIRIHRVLVRKLNYISEKEYNDVS